MPKIATCKFQFDDGSICSESKFGTSDFCIEHYHIEIMGEKMPVERSIEYAMTSIPAIVDSVEGVKSVLGIAIPQLIWGNVSPKVMQALTTACLAQAKIIELYELEAKVEELQAALQTDIRYAKVLDD